MKEETGASFSARCSGRAARLWRAACLERPAHLWRVLTLFLSLISPSLPSPLPPGEKDKVRDWVFGAGQSKRIWSELYKVIDSSDVLIQVLDARDPMGTRSAHLERYLKKEKAFKHLVFVLNKCDLVPIWSTVCVSCAGGHEAKRRGACGAYGAYGACGASDASDATALNSSPLPPHRHGASQKRWVATLSAEYPTLAFHASITNSFGKGALIQLLRQFGKVQASPRWLARWRTGVARLALLFRGLIVARRLPTFPAAQREAAD